MDKTIIYCDLCFKSFQVTGDKINYNISRKCLQIFCEPCSKKICHKCKVVCDKQQVSNLSNDDQARFLISDFAALKTLIKSHEFQQKRTIRYGKYMMAYTVKIDQKISEIRSKNQKHQKQKALELQKLQECEKQCEMLKKNSKDLQQNIKNPIINCQLAENTFVMDPPGNVENYEQNNNFPHNDISSDSFHFDPFNTSASCINQFTPSRRSAQSIVNNARYRPRVLPGRPAPLFQSTPLPNVDCNNSFGFSRSIPSTVYSRPKQITSKTFSRRP